jgi:hypothetical protein
MRKGNGMENVIGLGFSAGAIQIHEHNFPAHAAHNKRVGRGCAHHSAANNANFHNSIICIRSLPGFACAPGHPSL